MKPLILALFLLVQAPPPLELPEMPVTPLPKVASEYVATMRGMRIYLVKDSRIELVGSMCATGPYEGYSAGHVFKDGESYVAASNHGYGLDPRALIPVSFERLEGHDLVKVRPANHRISFQFWYARGPVPSIGQLVKSLLLLPGNSQVAPSTGIYLGEDSGDMFTEPVHLISAVSSPGASGSCVLDQNDKAWGILTGGVAWGKSPAIAATATVVMRLPKKD